MKSLYCRLALLSAAFIAGPAYGVMIGPGDGTGNTAQGTMVAGWNNVGYVAAASAVYLGNGWVITAKHVGNISDSTSVSFGALGSFTADGTVVRLKNPDNSNADLQLFHLDSSPALPTLQIAASSPAVGTFIYMAGYGRNRAADPTYYHVAPDGMGHFSWTVVSDPDTADYGGFQIAAGSTKRWGTNQTVGNPDNPGASTGIANAGYGDTHVFYANFYDDMDDYLNGGGTTFEGQLVNGDSGGGAFNSANQLIGINVYRSTETDQPDTLFLFGGYSLMADLSVYRDQILTVTSIPEPGGVAVLGCVLLALPRRRRG